MTSLGQYAGSVRFLTEAGGSSDEENPDEGREQSHAVPWLVYGLTCLNSSSYQQKKTPPATTDGVKTVQPKLLSIINLLVQAQRRVAASSPSGQIGPNVPRSCRQRYG